MRIPYGTAVREADGMEPISWLHRTHRTSPTVGFKRDPGVLWHESLRWRLIWRLARHRRVLCMAALFNVRQIWAHCLRRGMSRQASTKFRFHASIFYSRLDKTRFRIVIKHFSDWIDTKLNSVHRLGLVPNRGNYWESVNTILIWFLLCVQRSSQDIWCILYSFLARSQYLLEVPMCIWSGWLCILNPFFGERKMTAWERLATLALNNEPLS